LGVFVKAQSVSPEVVANGGDYFENSQVSVSWTVGEIAVETYIGSNNILTQGFQQPLLGVSSIVENPDFNVNVYPNPALNYVKVELDDQNLPAVLLVYDINGKLVKNLNLNENITEINIEGLNKGTYIIRLQHNGEESVYKLVKAE
jgi:hypothetical protein